MQTRIANISSYRNYQELDEVNRRVQTDPITFVKDCEKLYLRTIDAVARSIMVSPYPFVLLAGPSGSGKTTTARSLSESLKRYGIRTHTVELDNYFLSIDRSDLTIDWESPERLDIPLLQKHLETLEHGGEIAIPSFDFTTSQRTGQETPLRLGRNEIAIFEGIHALNDSIIAPLKQRPLSIYISARMRIRDETHVIFRPEWSRFLRRGLRDARFRGTPLQDTLTRWWDVRMGEKNYIMPNKYKAQIMIDTSMDYEVNLLAPLVRSQMDLLDHRLLSTLRMARLPDAVQRFIPLQPKFVPKSSIMREFIGDLGLDEV